LLGYIGRAASGKKKIMTLEKRRDFWGRWGKKEIEKFGQKNRGV